MSLPRIVHHNHQGECSPSKAADLESQPFNVQFGRETDSCVGDFTPKHHKDDSGFCDTYSLSTEHHDEWTSASDRQMCNIDVNPTIGDSNGSDIKPKHNISWKNVKLKCSTNVSIFLLVLTFIIVLLLFKYSTTQPQVSFHVTRAETNSESPLEYFRIKSSNLGYNVALAQENCVNNTILENCQLDMNSLLARHVEVYVSNHLVIANGTQVTCLSNEKGNEQTCFDLIDPEHMKVTISEYDTLNLTKVRKQVEYRPKLVFAFTPNDYSLWLNSSDFCYLDLRDRECLRFNE